MDPGDQSQVKFGSKYLTHLDILPAPNYNTQTDLEFVNFLSSPPQHWDYKHTTRSDFLMWVLGTKLRSHSTYKASSLLSELYSQPWPELLIFLQVS